MSSHEIEPELLRPVPRPVRRRTGRGSAVGCVQLFILPHTIVGIGVLLWALHGLIVLLSPAVPGTITGRSTTRSSKGGTTYYLHYTYRTGSDTYAAKYHVSSADYSTVRDGATMGVKVSPLTPAQGSLLQVPGRAPWKDVALRVGFALFWNSILSVFYWGLYVQPWLLRSLIIRGVPVAGKITGKNVISGKSTSYRLSYEYQSLTTAQSAPLRSTPAMTTSVSPTDSDAWASMSSTGESTAGAGATLEGHMNVNSNDYEASNIGDRVTVLYAPHRPQRSVIYRFADYEVMR